MLRQHDEAVLAALALPDVDHHPGAVDVADGQRHHLRHPQAGGVDGGECSAVLQIGDGAEEADDLFGRQHCRQLVGPPGKRQLGLGFRLAQGHGVEEPQRADDLVDRLRLQPARN